MSYAGLNESSLEDRNAAAEFLRSEESSNEQFSLVNVKLNPETFNDHI